VGVTGEDRRKKKSAQKQSKGLTKTKKRGETLTYAHALNTLFPYHSPSLSWFCDLLAG